MISFQGRHQQQDINLQCVRWYVAYSLSYRDLEELIEERGYKVNPAPFSDGSFTTHHASRRRFGKIGNGLAVAGGLTKGISKSKASGNISIVPSIKKATLSISY